MYFQNCKIGNQPILALIIDQPKQYSENLKHDVKHPGITRLINVITHLINVIIINNINNVITAFMIFKN